MKRVLIVDDAVTIRRYHRAHVESAGYEVEEALNGVDAMERVMAHHFDLVLVDINMPIMDGYRFLEQLRSHPDLCHLPAIMISTESKSSRKAQTLTAGANLYLEKPVQPETLKRCLHLMTSARADS